MSYKEKVLEFYKAFGESEYIADRTSLGDDNITSQRLDLKTSLIAEEFFELVEAVYGQKLALELLTVWNQRTLICPESQWNRDVVAAADATGDMMYVLEGFNIEAGIPSEDVFNEIHSSNMSKLVDGKPVLSRGMELDGKPLGKILKGDGYFPPNIKKILNV